jgi:hypothetical protein
LVNFPIGIPTYPNLEIYLENVELEKYDIFLILTRGRFTQNDLFLAEKLKSLGKSFFFIRTCIDVDYKFEIRRKKSFDEQAMLRKINRYCLANLKTLQVENVFLISNFYRDKWDFDRLIVAIVDVLAHVVKRNVTRCLSRTRGKFEKRTRLCHQLVSCRLFSYSCLFPDLLAFVKC